MKKKLALILSLILVLSAMLSIPASALEESVYRSYTYDYWGDEMEAPDSYVPYRTVRAEDVGLTSFNEPSDIFVSPNNDIYVVDSNNNRVVVFNADLTLKKEVVELKGDYDVLTMLTPKGIYVDADDNMYIADYGNHRTIKVDSSQNLVAEYLCPSSDVAFSGVDFLPMHVVVDIRNYVYVHCQGIYQGAVTYDNNGKFLGYFGGNGVTVNFNVIFKNLWRNFMTEAQISKMERNIPKEFTNMDITEEGFLLTCTSTSNSGNVRKIDPTGGDIIRSNPLISDGYKDMFGDTRWKYYLSVMIRTAIVDIAYDQEGFINCLDAQAGRVFQYSDIDGNLICIFGGFAEQEGTLKNAAAIDTMGDYILVLDSGKNRFTLFEPTAYVKSVKQAQKLYIDGKYDEALAAWQDVLKENGNLLMAYDGIGKAYYVTGDYENARKFFKLGYDKDGYIKALEYTRKQYINAAVPPLVIIIVILVLVIYGLKLYKYLKREKPRGHRPY